MMLRVAYDITSYTRSPFGGIASVCCHTFRQATLHPEVKPCAYYRSGDRGNFPFPDIPLSRSPRLRFWSGTSQSFDIAHSLCHRRLSVKATKHVYTVHDTWSLYPNKYQSSAFQKKVGSRLRREIEEADHIVTISASTRDSLLELGLASPEKVTPVLLGFELTDNCKEHPLSTDVSELGKRPFLLFVGALESRKNIGHLLEAMETLPHFDLVLVGEPGFGFDLTIEASLRSFPSDRLHRFSRIEISTLRWLYRNALALVLPSWEEGFGLPIVEAMAHGCPVITSNRSAMKEVAGEQAAILIEPGEPLQTNQAIMRLFEDPSFRQSLVEAGRKRAGELTWERYYGELISLYRKLLD